MVFQHLPQQTQLEFRRVCRSWHRLAMRNVTFRNEDQVNRFLMNFPNTMTELVNKITVEGPPTNELSSETSQNLMMKAPNLQELELKNRLLTIENLNDIELPPTLASINYSGSYYFTNESVNCYMNILLEHRNTIEKFNMSSSHNFRQYFENPHNDMINFLLCSQD